MLTDNGRDAIRLKAQDRALDRLDAQIAQAAEMVGQLMRNGSTVFYINERSAAGHMTGRTREFFTESAATSFLIRNRYV